LGPPQESWRGFNLFEVLKLLAASKPQIKLNTPGAPYRSPLASLPSPPPGENAAYPKNFFIATNADAFATYKAYNNTTMVVLASDF
jgi:hypothetical protein